MNLDSFLLITRPANVLIAGLSILIAALLVHPQIFTLPVLFATLSAMAITAGANVINDICDLEIDRINKPHRMLPSGRLSLNSARAFTLFLFVCGIIFSIFINLDAIIVACGSSLLLVAYSLWLKRKPVVGNLAVSFVTALAFIYGALAASVDVEAVPETRFPSGLWRAGLFPAVFSFLFHFGREVIKDIEDQAGDRSVSARTLPLAYGLKAAQITASLAFVALIAAVIMPYRIGMYGNLYLAVILGGVLPVLLLALFRLWSDPAPKTMRQISNLLKVDMVVGLIALYVGRYV